MGVAGIGSTLLSLSASGTGSHTATHLLLIIVTIITSVETCSAHVTDSHKLVKNWSYWQL